MSTVKISTVKKKRILFRLATCPYCKKAEEALDQAKIQYEKIEIDRNDRSFVQMLSGQPSVPVLVEVIGCDNQDDDIIEYIKELKNVRS